MRDPRIDVLRALGMGLLVIGHVGLPQPWNQLRNFNVPLLALVAGLAFLNARPQADYGSYVLHRAQRLLLPTWTFVSLFLLGLEVLNWPLARPDARTVLGSYLLTGGIGYLWIIKVFLGVALLAPWLQRWQLATASNARYLLGLLAALLTLEGSRLGLELVLPDEPMRRLNQTLFLALPYALVFALGLRLPQLSRRQRMGLALGCGLGFAVYALALWQDHGAFVPTQAFKYPPRPYYLSYALTVALLLWECAPQVLRLFARLRLSGIMGFLAGHTLWVYFWHIVLLPIARGPRPLQALEVLGGALLMAWLQVLWVERWLLPRLQARPKLQRWARLCLLG